MVQLKASKTYYDSEYVVTEKGDEKIYTYQNIHYGFTEMYFDDLVEGIEGSNQFLDIVLKKLLGFKEELKQGKIIRIHIGFDINEEERRNENHKFLNVEVLDKED